MKHKHSQDELDIAIRSSTTWAAVCRKLGIPPMTGSQSHLKKKAVSLGLDSSHFVGSRFTAGKTFGPKRPIEDYLNNKFPIKSAALRKRLAREGLKERKCELCLLTSWRGRPIPLELDHLNSDHFDNRLENLQVVCPNCHTQETVSRKRGRTPFGERAGLEPVEG